MSRIPLCRALIEDEELQAVEAVLKSGWLTHGPKNIEFENLFASYLGVKHAIAMNSCTSALFLAVVANNIKGDVLLPSFTFVASANAIVTAGARPVFADISYDDCNIDASLLEKALTPHTEALMVVHYAGQCCDMRAISEFARKHKLLLIEDSAETIGGTYEGKMSGNWGIGCFSFFPTKNITTGEGGMFTTNDDTLAEHVRALIGHGIKKTTAERVSEGKAWYREASYPGYNFRLSNILATLGVEQMKKLDNMNSLRRQHSAYLIDKLKDVSEISTPVEKPGRQHVYQMFTIKVRKPGSRDGLVRYLKEREIEASVHFDPPVHLHAAYKDVCKAVLPVTETVSSSIVTLPMFPQLTKKELDTIACAIKDYFSAG
ncbi:MAG: DegT/DnrJ/EryC1/StrS aminotransferase family protein [Nitrospirae bacterium]|nr:DegT/DnrJ/EryC1/StrS aminotransferase family protein [Nitrospirota bacterium]